MSTRLVPGTNLVERDNAGLVRRNGSGERLDAWKKELAKTKGMEIKYLEDLVADSSAKYLEKKRVMLWKTCRKWEEMSNTSRNEKKTEALIIEKYQRAIRLPVIRLDNGNDPMEQQKIKYLGLTVDRGMKYEHLKKTGNHKQTCQCCKEIV